MCLMYLDVVVNINICLWLMFYCFPFNLFANLREKTKQKILELPKKLRKTITFQSDFIQSLILFFISNTLHISTLGGQEKLGYIATQLQSANNTTVSHRKHYTREID